MLLIGTNKKKSGFTLLELMVTVAILASGIILVYEGFFVSLNAYSYVNNHIHVQDWMDKKVWSLQDGLDKYGSLMMVEQSGTFYNKQKEFKWSMDYALIDSVETGKLYQVDLGIFWQESTRNINLKRNFYLIQLAQ